jgi:hypothetical protein
VVSREAYGRYVCILRTLCVLSSFPQSVDFVAPRLHASAPVLPFHRLHARVFAPVQPDRLLPARVFATVLPFHRLPVRVFAPVQPAHLLLEAAARDARNQIPALRTFCRCGLVIESKMGEG